MNDEKTVAFADDVWQAGFTMMPNVVLMEARLSIGARLAWIMLAYYAHKVEECWPGQDHLAQKIGVNPTTLRRYLAELVEAGLLVIQRRGLTMTNNYRLTTPRQKPDRANRPIKNGQNARHIRRTEKNEGTTTPKPPSQRQQGTSPRALGTNPRAQGTNPRTTASKSRAQLQRELREAILRDRGEL